MTQNSNRLIMGVVGAAVFVVAAHFTMPLERGEDLSSSLELLLAAFLGFAGAFAVTGIFQEKSNSRKERETIL